MLSNKNFWVGALLAYGLAIFLPPQKLFGMKRRSA